MASQWVEVLNSLSPDTTKNEQAERKGAQACKRKQTITEKFFDIILTKEHCILDK